MLSVVKHVVKEPFLTRRDITAVACSEGLFSCSGLGYCNSAGAEMQVVFSLQAYQFLARLYKEYSLTGRGGASPAQEPTKACSCTLYSMVVVIARIQLEYRINPLALVKSMNLFCVLPDTSQKWVSSFVLLVAQRKVHVVRQTLWLMGENVLFHAGKPKRARHATNP